MAKKLMLQITNVKKQNINLYGLTMNIKPKNAKETKKLKQMILQVVNVKEILNLMPKKIVNVKILKNIMTHQLQHVNLVVLVLRKMTLVPDANVQQQLRTCKQIILAQLVVLVLRKMTLVTDANVQQQLST